MSSRCLSVFAAAVVVLVSGCASEPPPPLMSPLSETGRYGYADTKTGRDSYKITYSGPSVRTGSTRAGREEDRKAAKSQAHDLALWRAAQVAIENDYAAFDVIREDDEIEVTVREGYFPRYRPFYYGPGRYYRYPGVYGGFYDYPTYSTYRDTSLRAVITLDVTMKRDVADGEFAAAAVAARMAAKFPPAASVLDKPSVPGQAY